MTFKLKDIVSTDIESIMEDLPESKREEHWQKCISDTKLLVGQFKEIRMKIAEIALSCCVAHRGGSVAEGRYTVKAFAREIGVASGTLFEWIRMRQVFLALTKKEQANTSFTEIGQIARDMKGIGVRDDDFQQKIRAKQRELKKKNPCTIKMEKYLKHLKTIKFNVDHPRMISDCDEEVLTEILSICRGIVLQLAKQDKKQKYANV